MIDKRTLEFVLTDQQEELEKRAQEFLCHRQEETLIDLKSTQAQTEALAVQFLRLLKRQQRQRATDTF